MITIEDVREAIDTDKSDAFIEKTIERVWGLIRSYCNNDKLPTDDFVLDDVVLYLVLARLNEDRQPGVDSYSAGGFSVSYEKELPAEIKIALSRYKRATWL